MELKLTVNAYISEEVVSEDRLKLELYRRLANAESIEDVVAIEEEIKDRFGKIDAVTRNFLDLIEIKLLARKAGIKRIMNYQQNITIEYEDKKEQIKAASKDDEDILAAVLRYLKAA